MADGPTDTQPKNLEELAASLSPEDLAKIGEIQQATATAMGETVAAGGSEADTRAAARTALTETADRVNFDLSDENANKLVDLLMERMAAVGAFDPPPASDGAPPPAGASADAALSPEAAAAAAAAAAEATPPPAKRTFAERFEGG